MNIFYFMTGFIVFSVALGIGSIICIFNTENGKKILEKNEKKALFISLLKLQDGMIPELNLVTRSILAIEVLLISEIILIFMYVFDKIPLK